MVMCSWDENGDHGSGLLEFHSVVQRSPFYEELLFASHVPKRKKGAADTSSTCNWCFLLHLAEGCNLECAGRESPHQNIAEMTLTTRFIPISPTFVRFPHSELTEGQPPGQRRCWAMQHSAKKIEGACRESLAAFRKISHRKPPVSIIKLFHILKLAETTNRRNVIQGKNNKFIAISMEFSCEDLCAFLKRFCGLEWKSVSPSLWILLKRG